MKFCQISNYYPTYNSAIKCLCPNFDRRIKCLVAFDFVQDFYSHSDTCLFAKLVCPNGCEEQYLRGKNEEHLGDCPLHLLDCTHCSESFIRKDEMVCSYANLIFYYIIAIMPDILCKENIYL